jgi:hypothetical protein
MDLSSERAFVDGRANVYRLSNQPVWIVNLSLQRFLGTYFKSRQMRHSTLCLDFQVPVRYPHSPLFSSIRLFPASFLHLPQSTQYHPLRLFSNPATHSYYYPSRLSAFTSTWRFEACPADISLACVLIVNVEIWKLFNRFWNNTKTNQTINVILLSPMWVADLVQKIGFHLPTLHRGLRGLFQEQSPLVSVSKAALTSPAGLANAPVVLDW